MTNSTSDRSLDEAKSRSFDRVARSYRSERSDSYKSLLANRSQIADRLSRATWAPSDSEQATDPFASRRHQLAVASRAGSDAPLATAAASRRPPTRERAKGMVITERWEGRVLELQDGFFTAESHPAGAREPLVTGDISIDKVDAGDRELIVEGSPFFLLLGYIPIDEASRISVEFVRFNRVGNWQPEVLEDIEARVAARLASIEVDDDF